jgi:hypothetical protein
VRFQIHTAASMKMFIMRDEEVSDYEITMGAPREVARSGQEGRGKFTLHSI